MNNEKRAHDLTILYVLTILKAQKADSNNKLLLDPYSKYLELYNTILENVNRDFPQK